MRKVLCWIGFIVAAVNSIPAAEVSTVPPRWLQPYAAKAGDEDLIFTPSGFDKPGKPAIAKGEEVARLRVTVRDAANGRPTFCRVNVVGADGNFYQPQKTHLTPYSLTGTWPRTLAGNRPGKAPIRYLGRFFYSSGEFEIYVPPGAVRIEVWKGLEYFPAVQELTVAAKEDRQVDLAVERGVSMAAAGYYSGDPHLHFKRETAEDDRAILDLLEAEDVRYGAILCYNSPSSYDGRMAKQDIPQTYAGIGRKSIRRRGEYEIISGQEYRSRHFGHTLVYLADELVQAGKVYDPNEWPVFAEAVRDIRKPKGTERGIVFWAHGGYSQEIYADHVLNTADGMELMQFGIYRSVGLEGWYKMMNIGVRFPAMGASDYPACRKLADCRTYVWDSLEPGIENWLHNMAAGRSFMTTGPLILLEVKPHGPGQYVTGLNRPGGVMYLWSENNLKEVAVKARVRSLVCPVTHVDLIANGKVVKRLEVPGGDAKSKWVELQTNLNIEDSKWIAASAYSLSKTGNPDGEAHTNAVWAYGKGRGPYNEADLKWLLAKLDRQLMLHEKREISVGKEQVLAYFQKAREKLLSLQKHQGFHVINP